MRILILGAGAIGGYFGARLHEAGGNVTFFVRDARASKLAARELRVESPFGNLRIKPKTITVDAAHEDFDVIILSCKAYDLGSAMDSISPFAGADSIVLPLLNGVAHLGMLDSHFGRNRVLGGVAHMGHGAALRHVQVEHRPKIGALRPINIHAIERLRLKSTAE